LLHGAMSTIETSFEEVLPAFAETRQVKPIEQQAHGRTPDVERPLSYRPRYAQSSQQELLGSLLKGRPQAAEPFPRAQGVSRVSAEATDTARNLNALFEPKTAS
jgi:hypothetical protein